MTLARHTVGGDRVDVCRRSAIPQKPSRFPVNARPWLPAGALFAALFLSACTGGDVTTAPSTEPSPAASTTESASGSATPEPSQELTPVSLTPEEVSELDAEIREAESSGALDGVLTDDEIEELEAQIAELGDVDAAAGLTPDDVAELEDQVASLGDGLLSDDEIAELQRQVEEFERASDG